MQHNAFTVDDEQAFSALYHFIKQLHAESMQENFQNFCFNSATLSSKDQANP